MRGNHDFPGLHGLDVVRDFHAAGFFMPRGMKIFGWALIIGGCGVFAVGIPDWAHRPDYAYGIMGFFFGGLHLAYGVYLYFTEQRKNET